MDAIRNSTHTPRGSADLLSWCAKRLHEHEGYVIEHLEDLPDIKNWTLSRQPPTLQETSTPPTPARTSAAADR
jgi:hypothetical protein